MSYPPAMRWLALPVLLAIGCASSGDKAAAPSGPPQVGGEAPAFELPGSDGKTHRLADHRGKEVVVLAWFPAAFTGG
jgi:peroxiredoxin